MVRAEGDVAVDVGVDHAAGAVSVHQEEVDEGLNVMSKLFSSPTTSGRRLRRRELPPSELAYAHRTQPQGGELLD